MQLIYLWRKKMRWMMAQNKIDKGETDFKDFFKRFDEWQSSDEHTNVMKTKIQKMVAKVKSD